MAAIKRLLLSCLSLGLIWQNAFAELLEKGKSSAKLLFNFYNQKGDKGYQVYDGSGKEDAEVYEPMLFISHNISEETQLDAHFVFDLWTAASDTRLDGYTGTSGGGIEEQARGSGKVGFSRHSLKGKWGAKLGFSTEYDYRSFNLSGNWERSFAKDNFTLGVNGQIYKDRVRPFDIEAGSIAEWEDKDVYALNISGSQFLTRNDIIQTTVSTILQTGELESTSNSVNLNGVRRDEDLPNTRMRYALGTKWAHAFNDTSALHLSYRYYTDSWDIDAHTTSLDYLSSYKDDSLLVKFTYRYYTQDPTEYFQESFAQLPRFRTSDSDLANYDAHMVGVHLGLNLEKETLFGYSIENSRITLGLYRYERSNDLSYDVVQTSYGVEF